MVEMRNLPLLLPGVFLEIKTEAATTFAFFKNSCLKSGWYLFSFFGHRIGLSRGADLASVVLHVVPMVNETVIELNRGAVDIVERLFSWSNARNR